MWNLDFVPRAKQGPRLCITASSQVPEVARGT